MNKLVQGRGGKGSGVIYSIGYQKLDQKRLIEILKAHRVEVLVDVRSRPYGRIPVFNRNAMERWLPEAGIGYLWKGDILGGFAPIEDEAIRWLADFGRERTVCIMCMEADPEKCHRKTEIGRRIEAYGDRVEHL
jgi:ATP-dependent DNA helicase RecQ